MKLVIEPFALLAALAVFSAYIVAISKLFPSRLQLVKNDRRIRIAEYQAEVDPLIFSNCQPGLMVKNKGLTCPKHNLKRIWTHCSPNQIMKKSITIKN